jgi:hypothetical protein
LFQIILERAIELYCPLATTPRAADAMGRRRLGRVQFGQPRRDRPAGDPSGARDPRDPTSPKRCSFGSREEPTRPLVEKWRQHFESRVDGRFIVHIRSVSHKD